ncbi:DUF421 domain-containing protein [Gluconobacter roseus]|uniref:DUF421 domain-containing protein n=1 Tax=Gluconobacter roseus NBRC 3990 TaxID=1307950 RepID=A0A4Y3M4I9_9PROT|nr:YetF domain-containing protein [Gluconobacter roseus]GBR48434.1 hypothetical protein AA3990_2126 [Gluconobacter roseus NBRC 3990]GEB03277.1 DUF421 domain-containing protein [Gluconobacter roseus NBRC 3990]GLP93735.1 DUF421 domain-containing protein [Gluconobacter roseus NBRC 3990]
MTIYLWVLLKVIIGMTVIIGYLNTTGRNQISMMTSVDLVGNFVLGGVVGGIIYNDTLPITHYIALLFICVGVMVFYNYVSRKIGFLRKATIGQPIPIIRDGNFIMENLKQNANRIDFNDVATALRMQNIFSFEGIRYAQIETTGHVSVICDDDVFPSVFLVLKGDIVKDALDNMDRSEDWLHRQLAHLGFDRMEKVFLAQWIHDHILVVGMDGRTVTSKKPVRQVSSSGIASHDFTASNEFNPAASYGPAS